MMLEQSDKNETIFVYAVLIISLFNIVLGYKDRIEKLPYRPWPSKNEYDEENPEDRKGSKAKDKNKLKKET